MKKLAVIGSGGREHAIARKLLSSPHVEQVFMIPGNAATDHGLVNINLDMFDSESLISFLKENDVYYCIVGPEAPLANGLMDDFKRANIPAFGPTKKAAQLEASKEYSKEVMISAEVPTASSKCFSDKDQACEYLKQHGAPVVIKADGLAAGKGVTVAFDLKIAESAVKDCLEGNRFGESGSSVLIEDFLEGREASVMAIINKGHICLLPVSSDFKRVGDNHTGANTGGMGAVSPSPVFPESRLNEVKDKVFRPVIECLKKEGIEYSGFLYAGLMVDQTGAFKILEFNCRLGDPETQSILLRIEEDFFKLMESAIFSPENLPEIVSLSEKTSLTVVLASAGYPELVQDKKVITGLQNETEPSVQIFHAGTRLEGNDTLSKGGRILSVSAVAENLENARADVYNAIKNVNFEGMHFRKDIGIL